MFAFYVWWYPAQYIRRFGGSLSGELSAHLRFCERASRKLARAIFHGMMVYRQRLERKQAFLFRVVDIAMEIFAVAASVARARALRAAGGADATTAVEVADAFGRAARRRIESAFHELWHNDDAAQYAFAQRVLDGRYVWIEQTEGAHDSVVLTTPPRSDQGVGLHPGMAAEAEADRQGTHAVR